MTSYKNCINAPIKLRFDNKTMVLLNKNEHSPSVNNIIIEIQKKIMVTTLTGTNIVWKPISYEINDNNEIYENISIKGLGLHSVSSII